MQDLTETKIATGISEKLLAWLMQGDPSIQYQAWRDLLDQERSEIRDRIAREGWAAAYLALRKPDGHWGKGFYQPKWTSSHYTLLDLRNLCIAPDNPEIRQFINKILKECKAGDGGIYPIAKKSDACINGMVLNYASYFGAEEKGMESIVDCLLRERMQDGGFNCRSNRSGAVHSSLHTTLSVLEGLGEYMKNGYQYRTKAVVDAISSATEFILKHRLFISDRTGRIIHKDFLKLSYPRRWRYDVLSALDYFQYSGVAWDDRMQDAIEVILKKRTADGRWKLQAKHPGQTHFDMEKAGRPSRWNTLRALRVLKHFGLEEYER